MSSETSEDEMVDIGPVSGSRPVGAADPPNPAFDLEASLSRLEPPRHRLIPVERVAGVRVERSERVTVERAGTDDGGQSETVRIERTETVYDDESDAVRIERSESVRVERIHASPQDSAPSLLQTSSADRAQEMLDASPEVNGASRGVKRTSIPSRPPPSKYPAPDHLNRDLSVSDPSEPVAADETIIEAQLRESGEHPIGQGQRQPSSQRIEVPERRYQAVEVNEEDPSPGAYRFKAQPSVNQRRQAFFLRPGAGELQPDHSNESGRSEAPEVIDIGSPKTVTAAPPGPNPEKDAAEILGIPRPKFRSEQRYADDESPGEHTGDIEPDAFSGYVKSNGSHGHQPLPVDEVPSSVVPALDEPHEVDEVEPSGLYPSQTGPPKRRRRHPAPPQFEARKPERQRPQAQRPVTPSGPHSRDSKTKNDSAQEVDPFDEYLHDPLGFFDPSGEIDIVKPGRTNSTTELGAASRQKSSNNGLGSRRQRSNYDDQRDFGQHPDSMDADRNEWSRRQPANRADAAPQDSRWRPESQRLRRTHGDRPDDGYRQDHDDGDYRDDHESSSVPRRELLRSKVGAVLAGIIGVVVIGLSAMYVLSGDEGPKGEILESEGFYWWVDADSATRSWVAEPCADSLQSLGAVKKSVPFSDVDKIERVDLSCEDILAPSS